MMIIIGCVLSVACVVVAAVSFVVVCICHNDKMRLEHVIQPDAAYALQ